MEIEDWAANRPGDIYYFLASHNGAYAAVTFEAGTSVPLNVYFHGEAETNHSLLARSGIHEGWHLRLGPDEPPGPAGSFEESCLETLYD